MAAYRSISRPLRPLRAVTIGGVLAIAGLALGPIPQAAAELGAPQLQSFKMDGTTAWLEFMDNSGNETEYLVTIRERNNPDNVVRETTVPASPGSQRMITRNVDNVRADIPLCASIKAQSAWPFVLNPNDNPSRPLDDESPPSNTICSDPANVPADVALQNIRGNAAPQAAQSPAYLVALRNAGGADATGVVVDVSTSGVATLGDQAGVAAGWAADGFACAPVAPAGGQTSALRCTGGTLKKGQETAPAVIVKFTDPGIGAIHAQISGAGNTTPGNNGTALNVTPS